MAEHLTNSHLRSNCGFDLLRRFLLSLAIISSAMLSHQERGYAGEWFEGSCAKLQEEFRRTFKHDSSGNPISFQGFEKSRYFVTGIAHRCNGIVRIRYLDGERWCYALIQYLPKAGRLTMDANPHYCCERGPCNYNPR